MTKGKIEIKKSVLENLEKYYNSKIKGNISIDQASLSYVIHFKNNKILKIKYIDVEYLSHLNDYQQCVSFLERNYR